MSITQCNWSAFKTDSIQNQPIRKRALLSDLRFHTLDTVEYKGLLLGLDRRALRQIISMVGFSVNGTKSLSESVGEDGSIQILNRLKNIITNSKSIEITLSVSSNRVIVDCRRGSEKNQIISAESYFDIVEREINKHDLDVQQTSFNPETGKIFIEALRKKDFQVGNFSDETFHPGISFSRNSEGLSVEPFLNRLICTNGMIARGFQETHTMSNLTATTLLNFQNHLEAIERHNFIPSTFSEKVELAKRTPASLRELSYGIDLLRKSTKKPLEDSDVEMFIPFRRTFRKLTEFSLDSDSTFFDMNEHRQRNIRTGVTVWQVINGITDFASHNYGFEKIEGTDRHLQLRAGDMFTKTFDSTNHVVLQPF